jgi:hypothetical protein
MGKIAFHKLNAEQAADRLYRFYSRQMGDEILATLAYPRAAQEPPLVTPSPDDEIVRERDPLAWKGLPLLQETYQCQARDAYENPDDSLLSVIPIVEFEGAIETLMLGGQARYVGTRLHTWGEPVKPLIEDYDLFNWELPEERNEWLQRYLAAYRYMVRRGPNGFALNWSAEMLAMNLAVQLRGAERAYLDMYDEPENLQRLLDYSYDLHLYLFGRVQEIVAAHNATLYGDHPLAQYRVDRQPNQSVDAYSVCRRGVLRQFGATQLARFMQTVGGGNLHIHQNGRHIIEEIAEIPGWREVRFTDGGNWEKTFDLRWEMRRRMKDIPIVIRCEEQEFLQALASRDLPGNTRYVLSTRSLEHAKRLMDQVRAYRAPARKI